MNSRPVALRHGFTQRGFADARRTDEAEDRPLHLLGALLHSEKLDDPLLHLLQAVMVGVEGGPAPRQGRCLTSDFSLQGMPSSQSM